MDIASKKVFEELDFTVRRADFERARKMIESLKGQYAPGSDEYREVCYYELLTHYNATDLNTVEYWINYWSKDNPNYYDEVMKYADDSLKVLVRVMCYDADKPFDFIPDAERFLKDRNYKKAIEYFKCANELQRVVDTALTAAKAALKENDFSGALEYLNYALFDDSCYEEYKKVKKYEQAYSEFQKEIGSPQKYAVEALKAADSAKYQKYVSLSSRSRGYTDGVVHFIAVLVAFIASIFMFFDPDLDIPALYVIWGIAASVALHRKCMWDFGVIRSIGGTFLLCAAPALLTAFAYEVLDADGLGALVTAAVTLIEFIPTLVRNIKYMNRSNDGKKAVALRTQFVEPALNNARREIAEKYARLTDRETAASWANIIKL